MFCGTMNMSSLDSLALLSSSFLLMATWLLLNKTVHSRNKLVYRQQAVDYVVTYELQEDTV